jgi:hypothetical protein
MQRLLQPGWRIHRTRIASFQCAGFGIGLLLALGVANPLPAWSHEVASADDATNSSMRGHGEVSIGYETTLVNGFLPDAGPTKPIGTVRSRRMDLDLEYYVADRWSVSAGIPFISNRYQGPNPHCPTTAPPQCAHLPALAQPHPESQFLDDGNFHGTLQDWSLGVAYHVNFDAYYITPSIGVYLPTHDYTFFSQAAVGQDLQQVDVYVTLQHQFDFSQLGYSVGYGYVFSEKTLGYSINYNHFDLELDYFISPRWTVRVSTLGRIGNGVQFGELNAISDGKTNNVWYHHDQISAHEYISAGGGVDYHFGDKYTLSATAQTLVWGSSVFNFRYLLDVHLTRYF